MLKSGRFFLIMIILLGSFVACNRTAMKKPSVGLLSKQLVEDILIEIYLLEGRTKVIVYYESTEKARMRLNYEIKKIFEHYNTNYKQFVDSYSYYMGNAAISKKMMSDLTNRLIVLEAEQTENTKLIDSLIVI